MRLADGRITRPQGKAQPNFELDRALLGPNRQSFFKGCKCATQGQKLDKIVIKNAKSAAVSSRAFV
jgi:hypothetical protein